MKLKCKGCKNRFTPPARGRRPRFCSAACRQKAYRKRAADPHRRMILAFESDLYKIRDTEARMKAAVKVLEEAGYEVFLERRSSPRRAPKTKLTVVSNDETGSSK